MALNKPYPPGPAPSPPFNSYLSLLPGLIFVQPFYLLLSSPPPPLTASYGATTKSNETPPHPAMLPEEIR